MFRHCEVVTRNSKYGEIHRTTFHNFEDFTKAAQVYGFPGIGRRVYGGESAKTSFVTYAYADKNRPIIVRWFKKSFLSERANWDGVDEYKRTKSWECGLMQISFCHNSTNAQKTEAENARVLARSLEDERKMEEIFALTGMMEF